VCVENCPCSRDYCHFSCELRAAVATTVCRPNCGDVTCFVEQNEVPNVEADCPNGECYVRSGSGLSVLSLRNHGQYTVDCLGASECQVLCQGGSNCEVFCDSSSTDQKCTMTCEGEGTCSLMGSRDPVHDLTCLGSQKYVCQNGGRCGLSCDVPLGP
jgi:hypothetical protein